MTQLANGLTPVASAAERQGIERSFIGDYGFANGVEEVVRALLEGGYDGWTSSEFEGDAPDSLAMVKAHQAMIRGYIAKYAAA